MQRPIEFRAWDKQYKRIFAVESINWFYREVKIITHDDEKTPSGETIISTEVRPFDEVELMQYTGLKDRNGVKIWEGDVLTPIGRLMGPDTVVKYEGAAFTVARSILNLPPMMAEAFEVIGDIYRNPDLIKGAA